jgi:multidrug efflux system membrane fusion protein
MAWLTPGVRSWIGRAVAVAAFASVALLGTCALRRIDRAPRTQDAYLYADSAAIAPEVSGRVAVVHIHENQRVAKGEPLVEIDREPFELRVEQARAQVEAIRAQIGVASRQVASQASGAKAAATQIERARTQLALARNNVTRITPLLDKGYATEMQGDEARTNENVAQAALSAAIQQTEQAQEAVGDTESLRAQLAGAESAVRLAERDLRNTIVHAPFDGLVAGLDLPEGAYATAGHPLFTLIKTDAWYAVGNFRETELASVAVGDKATVWLIGSRNQSMSGRVESLGWGINPEDIGAPGLPNVGRTLDWVIVAQRFPVRVRLDGVPEGLSRIGATANIVVTHGDEHDHDH